MYVAKFTSDAIADIKLLPKNVRNALRKELEKVVLKNPLGCSEALTGPLLHFRSFHFRDYGVVYRVFQDLKAVAFVGVGKKNSEHYAEIYKKLESLVGAGKLADTLLQNLRSVGRG